MHFVSELVFASATQPDIRIVEWLSECVTFRDGTKKFSLFTTEDVVDPSPVLRSFLIKLFLQCRTPMITDHMDKTIRSWVDDPVGNLQRMNMVISCHKVKRALIIYSDICYHVPFESWLAGIE